VGLEEVSGAGGGQRGWRRSAGLEEVSGAGGGQWGWRRSAGRAPSRLSPLCPDRTLGEGHLAVVADS